MRGYIGLLIALMFVGCAAPWGPDFGGRIVIDDATKRPTLRDCPLGAKDQTRVVIFSGQHKKVWGARVHSGST
jgi:hypothetical protein